MMCHILTLFKRLKHRHAFKQRMNWAMLNGDLVCLRTTICECGHESEKVLLLVATAANLAEANAKQITQELTPNVGAKPTGKSAALGGSA